MPVCVYVRHLNEDECIQVNGLTIECTKEGVLEIQGINRKNDDFQRIEVVHKDYFDSRIDEITAVVFKNVKVSE